MPREEVFERVEFDRRDKRPLSFEGIVVASVDSRDYEDVVDDREHWTELVVYRTRGGKFILRTVACTSVEDEIDWNKAVVRDTLDDREVMDFFEQRWLSKKLYELLGMDPTAHID